MLATPTHSSQKLHKNFQIKFAGTLHPVLHIPRLPHQPCSRKICLELSDSRLSKHSPYSVWQHIRPPNAGRGTQHYHARKPAFL